MSRIRQWWILALMIAPLTAGACSQATTAEPQTPASPSERSDAEIEALFRARLDSARMRFTDADVRFMTGMIHHHAQAIDISRLAPTHTDNPTLHTLGARITNAQRDEIATMQRWLRDRNQTVPELHVTDTGVMVHGADHSMHMPGMLTPEQLRDLDAARGAEFDRLFLTLMIQHHNGAVTMVRDLFDTDGAGQDEDVFRFAADVHVDQVTEVERMKLMLSAMQPE